MEENARGCTVDDYVAKAVAGVVKLIYLCSCRHGVRSLFIYVIADMVVLFVNNCWYHLDTAVGSPQV